MKVIFDKRYELLDYAEQKGLPSIFDLLENIKPLKSGLACTDGKTIYVNPEEFNVLDIKDEFFVLSHELLHITYQHHKMNPSIYKDRELLNICQDIVINEYLVKKLRHRPQIGVFFDSIQDLLESWGYHNEVSYDGILTTKALYEYLIRFRNQYNFDEWVTQNTGDLIEETEDQISVSQDIIQEVREALKITNKIMNNENPSIPREEILETQTEEDYPAGHGRGQSTTIDGGQIRTISKQDIIKFVQEFIGTHAVVKGRSQTYRRPNRRFHSSELLLKGMQRTKTVKEIAIYLDTSGSMSYQFIQDIYTTLRALYQTTKFKFYTFDYEVDTVNMRGTDINYGGGTNIMNVLRHIEDNKHDVSIMITDCEDRFTLRDVKTELMIFTNNDSFKSDNPKVRVTYWS